MKGAKIGVAVMGTIGTITGILLILMGIWMKTNFKNGIDCVAVITDVETDTSTGEFTSYYSIYYGEYTVNGQEYTNIKLERRAEEDELPDFSIGDRVVVRVDKKNPAEVLDGGDSPIAIVMGVLCLVGGFFFFGLLILIKLRPKKKEGRDIGGGREYRVQT